MHGGDPVRGKSVFETSVSAQCTLCHRVGRNGSNVGPPLSRIGFKEPRYLLEALIDPAAVVAPGFGMTVATLKDGSIVAGTLMEETGQFTIIKSPDGESHSLDSVDIASRTPETSSMPPMGTLMNRHQLRDLLAYLKTLQRQPRNGS